MTVGPSGFGSSDDPPTPPTPDTDPDVRARLRALREETFTTDRAPLRTVTPAIPRRWESAEDPTTARSLEDQGPLTLALEDPATPHTHSGPRPTPASQVTRAITPEQEPAPRLGPWARLLRWLGL